MRHMLRWLGLRNWYKMNQPVAFWPAFWVGLAGPVTIYNSPPPYWAYVGGYSVAQTFAMVGNAMSYTVGGGNGGQSSGSSNFPDSGGGIVSGIDPYVGYAGTGLVSASATPAATSWTATSAAP
jgi:hypothetical protein